MTTETVDDFENLVEVLADFLLTRVSSQQHLAADTLLLVITDVDSDVQLRRDVTVLEAGWTIGIMLIVDANKCQNMGELGALDLSVFPEQGNAVWNVAAY